MLVYRVIRDKTVIKCDYSCTVVVVVVVLIVVVEEAYCHSTYVAIVVAHPPTEVPHCAGQGRYTPAPYCHPLLR